MSECKVGAAKGAGSLLRLEVEAGKRTTWWPIAVELGFPWVLLARAPDQCAMGACGLRGW